MKIKFREHNPGTVVNFAVGKSYESAHGETITDLADQLLKVGFPNKIFLSVEHVKKPFTGRLSIEFWFKDQTVENLNGEKVIDGYSLIKEIKGKFPG